jgi:hypothetical protein
VKESLTDMGIYDQITHNRVNTGDFVIIQFRTCCLLICLKLLKIKVYRTIVLPFVL